MKVNKAKVTFSSIVSIGEEVSRLEKETGEKYLKLHRGVMDVTNLNMTSSIAKAMCSPTIDHYGPNDGWPDLLEYLNEGMPDNTKTLITPGGMAALDLLIESMDYKNFYVPNFHWGSWSKILITHDKEIKTYDDFNLSNFRPRSGVVMLCVPSNPTGYRASDKEIEDFLNYASNNNIVVILDLPYWDLLCEEGKYKRFISENVIIVSSYSKSLGLSGYRVGSVSTLSDELYQSMRVRSLYKYNSPATITQYIISNALYKREEMIDFRKETADHISRNIELLKNNGLLYDGYPTTPIGPFAIVNISQNELMSKKISSVPLTSFTIDKDPKYKGLSRISVAVRSEIFEEYFKVFKK
jgi:aspartate/methionine/tyrosine aminotransferase